MTRSCGAHAEESAEGRPVTDVDQSVDVTFQIGLNVVSVPQGGIDIAVPNRWIEAGPEEFFQSGWGSVHALEFAETEGQQRYGRDTTGQALGDLLHESELLGTGQYEQSHPTVVINSGLQVGEEVGTSLSFVNDGAVRELVEEAPRILGGKIELVGILQRNIGPVWEHVFDKGRFAGLPGAGDGHDGKPLEDLGDRFSDGAGDQHDLNMGHK